MPTFTETMDQANLTPRTQRIMTGRFVENKTLETIGQELGLSRERIRQLESRGIWTIVRFLGMRDELRHLPMAKVRAILVQTLLRGD